MRKSSEEKLRIIKHATSRKKIKQLAELNGVNVKTVKNWVKAFKNGKLQPKPVTNVDNEESVFLLEGIKPFAEIILKITKEYLVFEDRPVFRFLIKDINYGFVFCSYASIRYEKDINAFIQYFIKEVHEYFIDIKQITADKSCDISDMEILKAYSIKFQQLNYKDIKKHLKFSLKKNSYIKERTRYENIADFLFDSLATVSKNNEIFLDKFGIKSNKFIQAVKRINVCFHSDFMNSSGNIFNTDKILSVLHKMYHKAQECSKNNNCETSECICEKLFYILNHSEYDNELLLRTKFSKIEACFIKNETAGVKHNLKSASNLARFLPDDKRNKYLYRISMLHAHSHKMKDDHKSARFYLKKAYYLVKEMNNEEEIALFFLEAGKIVLQFKQYRKALLCYNRLKEIIERNNFISVSEQAKEFEDQIKEKLVVNS